MSDDEKVKVIQPLNTLKAKVKVGGPGAVDLAVIERAEKVIADMTDSYLEWVEEDLVKIRKAYENITENQDGPAEGLEELYQISHDMKGQGGSFDYDLMTILGNDLCYFVEGKETASATDLAVIELYIDTMKVVITKRMNGNGGAEGQKVLTGLSAVVKKITGAG